MAFTRPKAAQIDFDITNITDPLIRLNSGETGSADKDVGIVIERGDDTNVAMLYDESADQFVLVNTTETGTTSGNVTISSYAGLQADAIVYGSLNDGTTTLTATVAELNYVDGVTSNIQTQIDNISSSFTLAADSGSSDTFTTGQTLTFTGGTGIDTTVSDNTITYAIDSTVATLTGTQTLTNKTLDVPIVTGNLTVDTNTLFVNAANNRVGIGTASPAYQVEIENTGANALLVLDRTDGAACFIEGQATRSAFGSVGATPLALAYNSFAVVTIGANGAITVNPDGDGFTFPTTDGSANQFLQTDGEGAITFASATVSDISDLTATATELNYLDGVTGITLGTANELLIVGSDGTSIISDSTLSIDTGSNYIGINQSSPEVTLHMTGEGAQTAQVRMEQYNDSADAPDLRTRRYRGTIASPLAVNSGDYLYRSNHEYWNGSALIVGGTFAFDNTNNANRTQFAVSVTTDGTSADANTPSKVQFKIDGNDSGAITFNNAYKFPTSDGSANQFLQTNGSGALTFASATVSDISDLTATATELNYVDGVTSAIQTQLDAKLALAGGTMSGAIAMGTNKITGMGDPTANQDAATKAYVDTQTSSIVTTTDIAGDTGTDTVTLGSDTLTFSGTANKITTAVTDNTVTISLPDDVTIGSDLTVTGNLTVNGTTTTISTTNSVVSDSLIELNTSAGSNANDLGFIFERGSTGDNAAIIWDESADKFVVGTTTATGASTGDLTVTTGTLVANIEGNVTGNITGDVTGNADTATALATARNIAGQSFDGTGDITIASTDLSDTASIVLTTASQTLTNKTLTAPVISTISNTGTLTLPTSTGTVALTSDITLSTLSITATATELNYTDGVTSAIQTQLDAKAPTAGPTFTGTLTYATLNDGTTALTSTVAELNILDGVTATAAELNILDGVTATTAELNYTDGVTSAIQTQLDAKASLTGSETLTNKTLTSPQVNTNIDLLAQADLRFYDSDDSNYVGFQGPATATGNILWTLPGSDGTEGQVLSTNGGGTLTWEDPGSGGGSGSSYPNSTFSTVPGTNGNFDMSYNVAQTTQETPFESGGTDAFGVNLGSVFSLMDPIGSLESIDYGDSEAYVGA